MLKKFYNWIFSLCTLAGFIFMIGTAGASDLNTIDFKTSLIQYGIALALMFIGFVGLKLSDREYVN